MLGTVPKIAIGNNDALGGELEITLEDALDEELGLILGDELG